jgi:deoxyhypusine synthase
MPRSRKSDFMQVPVRQVDVAQDTTVADMVDAFKQSSFQARQLGMAAQVWENALQDPDRPTIVMGLAGSLMAGGLRKVIRDVIANHLVDVVVTVGSQPYQDLYAARGYNFWRSSPDVDDLELRSHFLDRLYDTVVDEEKFRETDDALGQLFAKLEPRGYTSRELYDFLGKQFDDPNSWVVTAAKEEVPIFCPAVNDSSLGIGMVQNFVKARKTGKPFPTIDPIRDAYELAQVKMRSKKTMVLYIAGGVSKNYIQQTEVISEVLGTEAGGHQYAVQLTTDSDYWGGLSGCTFKEAQSWGKIAADAKMAQCHVDVTIGFPLLAGAVYQRTASWQGRKRLRFDYEDSELRRIEHVAAGKGTKAGKKR